jgi:hypothetical protein
MVYHYNARRIWHRECFVGSYRLQEERGPSYLRSSKHIIVPLYSHSNLLLSLPMDHEHLQRRYVPAKNCLWLSYDQKKVLCHLNLPPCVQATVSSACVQRLSTLTLLFTLTCIHWLSLSVMHSSLGLTRTPLTSEYK